MPVGTTIQFLDDGTVVLWEHAEGVTVIAPDDTPPEDTVPIALFYADGTPIIPGSLASLFNVKDYGAVGDGATNDADAIEAALAALAASDHGGILYFPPGAYIYSGSGISHNPATRKPLLIQGAGIGSTEVTFSSVSNSFCIDIDSQGAVGSGVDQGNGIRDISFAAGGTDDVIRVKDLEHFLIDHVFVYTGHTALTVEECRFGRVEHLYAFGFQGTGINVIGEVYSMTWFKDCQLTSDENSDWAFDYSIAVGAAGAGGGIFLDTVVSNSAGAGGFRFQCADFREAFPVLTNCCADGFYSGEGMLFKNVGVVYVVNPFIVNHGRGGTSYPGISFDGVVEASLIGGVSTSPDAATGASDLHIANQCENIFVSGIRLPGVNIAVDADSSDHLNVTLDLPPITGGGTAVGNPDRLFTLGDTSRYVTPFTMLTSDAVAKEHAFILQDAGLSGSNRKFLRMSGATFQILNAAFTTVIQELSDAGALYLEDSLALKDGVTAPGTVAGRAQIYVDTADGDLKVKFGDGTVKTISVDT